ncbi:MAG: hypothetical protein MJY66_08065 [Bacteroidaceae bacterium]|nr:hypothetical protein [Bacteroidaceae bacterium]
MEELLRHAYNEVNAKLSRKTNDIACTFVVDFMDSFHKLYALMMTRYGSIPFHDFVVYVLSIRGIKVKTMAQLLSVSVNSIRVKKYRMNHLLNESDLQAAKKMIFK